LKPLKNYDSILLVCTHYPAIETEIKEIGYKKDAWLVDGNSIGETVMTIPVNT